jgi:hypothetical protein
MVVKNLFAFAFFAGFVWADPIVTMQLQNSPGEPNIYQFLVNGSETVSTLCDDALHSVTTNAYQATESTLNNLSGTLLQRNGDPQALLDYEDIAILDLQAFANPTDITLIRNVVLAEWSITQGRTLRDPGAEAELSWVATQDPANYNLQNFVIFSTPNNQEQTGFPGGGPGGGPVPEPGAWMLSGAGLLICAIPRVRRFIELRLR